MNERVLNKLRDELLCVFDSVILWEAPQGCPKSFVKCYCVVQCVLLLASSCQNIPDLY